MRQITPFPVWVGHGGDGRAFPELFELGIRAVVQLAAEELPIQTPRELVFFRVPLVDGGGNDVKLLDLAVRSVAALLQRGIPALVCCGGGMSRSPVIVAAALAVLHGNDFEGSLKLVTEEGPADFSTVLLTEVKHVITSSGGADTPG